MKFILFIDDDRRFMTPFCEAIDDRLGRAGYKVTFFSDVDSALDFAQKYASNVALVIWDMMMPPGEAFSAADTNKGLRTGRALHAMLRSFLPVVPMILFTNVPYDDVHREYRSEPLDSAWRKEDLLPDELADKVAEILSPASAQSGTSDGKLTTT